MPHKKWCDLCTFTYDNPYEELKHISSLQHKLRSNEYYCSLCKYTAAEVNDYVKHVEMDIHKTNLKKNEDRMNGIRTPPPPKKTKHYSTRNKGKGGGKEEEEEPSPSGSRGSRKENERGEGPKPQVTMNTRHGGQSQYGYNWSGEGEAYMQPRPFERNSQMRSTYPHPNMHHSYPPPPPPQPLFPSGYDSPQPIPWLLQHPDFSRPPPPLHGQTMAPPFLQYPPHMPPEAVYELQMQLINKRNEAPPPSEMAPPLPPSSSNCANLDDSRRSTRSGGSVRSAPSPRKSDQPARLMRGTVERSTMPVRTTRATSASAAKEDTVKGKGKVVKPKVEKKMTPSKAASSKHSLFGRLSIYLKKPADKRRALAEETKGKHSPVSSIDSPSPIKKKVGKRTTVPSVVMEDNKKKKWDSVATRSLQSYVKNNRDKKFKERNDKYKLSDDNGGMIEEFHPDVATSSSAPSASPVLSHPPRSIPLSAGIWGTGSEVMKPERVLLPTSARTVTAAPPPPTSRVESTVRPIEDIPPDQFYMDDSVGYASVISPHNPNSQSSSTMGTQDATYSNIDVSSIFKDVHNAVSRAEKNRMNATASTSSAVCASDRSVSGFMDPTLLANSAPLATSSTYSMGGGSSTSPSTLGGPSPCPEPVVKREVPSHSPSPFSPARPPAESLPCPAFTPHPNRSTNQGTPSSMVLPPPSATTNVQQQTKTIANRVIKEEVIEIDDETPMGEEKNSEQMRELWQLCQDEMEVQKRLGEKQQKMNGLTFEMNKLVEEFHKDQALLCAMATRKQTLLSKNGTQSK